MIAAMLHGVFAVWRHGTDKETIYEWGVYQVNEKREIVDPILNYKYEIICEARVPIYTSKDPEAILQCDIDAAIAVLNADLIDQVKTRSDLAGVRAQFSRQLRMYPPLGKPKPPVEVVDEHDWNLMWKNATGF
jgi:hypothetical protein